MSFFIRVNWGDTGAGPSQRGNSWSSPDVINVGITEVNPADLTKTFLNTYSDPNTPIMVNIKANTTNYVYLRGSATSALANCKFKVFAMPFNSGLPPYNQWITLKTPEGRDVYDTAVETPTSPGVPQGLYVVPKPFLWTDAGNTQTIHHCFLVFAAENGSSFPDFNNLGDLGTYLRNHPNSAQRNIGYNQIDPNSNIYPNTTLIVSPKNLNPGFIRLTATDVPVGWDVAFEADQNDSNGNRVVLPRTTITTVSGHTVGWLVQGKFDQGWTSQVKFYAWPGVNVAPPTWELSIDLVEIVQPTTGPTARGKDPFHGHPTDKPIPYDAKMEHYFNMLGSCKIEFKK